MSKRQLAQRSTGNVEPFPRTLTLVEGRSFQLLCLFFYQWSNIWQWCSVVFIPIQCSCHWLRETHHAPCQLHNWAKHRPCWWQKSKRPYRMNIQRDFRLWSECWKCKLRVHTQDIPIKFRIRHDQRWYQLSACIPSPRSRTSRGRGKRWVLRRRDPNQSPYHEEHKIGSSMKTRQAARRSWQIYNWWISWGLNRKSAGKALFPKDNP